MASGARVCPHCGALGSADAARCHRCGKALPGPLQAATKDLLTRTLGTEFPVTKLLVGLCLGVFVLGAMHQRSFPLWFGDSLRRSEMLSWGLLAPPWNHREPWRYLAAVFVHFNALHVAFNTLTLLSFGRPTEGAIRSGRFAIVFVLTGALGFVASDLWYELWYGMAAPTAGASGAVFGVIGAQAGDLWARRVPDWQNQVWRAVGYAVLLFVLFWSFGGGLGVNNAAHFGGLAVGLGLGYAFGRERRALRRDKLFGWIGAVLVGLSVASLVASHFSPAWRIERQREIQLGQP